MMQLPELNQNNLDDYYKIIKSKILDGIDLKIKSNSKIYLSSQKLLVKNLRKLLLSKPKDLVYLNKELYAEISAKVNSNKDKEIMKIFDYDKFISGSKSTSYEISNLIGQNTCTYCNKNYTLTVIKKDRKNKNGERKKTINNEERISRPQFDHWFPQSKFPLLALSIYNLIPSCSVCNSSVKGSTEFNISEHIHPYIKEKVDFDFTYHKAGYLKNEVKIKTILDSKTDKTLKLFKIEEQFQAHSDFELKDLIDLKYKYSDNYLKLLANTFKTKLDRSDVYRLFFGVELDDKKVLGRPMSKFKKNILGELGFGDFF